MASRIFGHAFFHPLELFGRRGRVVPRFPLDGGHAVNNRTAGLLVRATRLGDPVTEAIAAKSRKAHQIDVRGVAAVLEQTDKAAKGRGGDGIVERVERVVRNILVLSLIHI